MLNRKNMKKQTVNLGSIVCLLVAVYFVYGALLQDGLIPASISTVWEHFRHWAKHFRVLAVALLPVYVALMVFGTSIVGIYLGSAIQRWFTRVVLQKKRPATVVHKLSRFQQ
jgi:hypothetical protein